MKDTATTTAATATDWRCPPWCIDTADHAGDSLANDGGQGGAVHHSRGWHVPPLTDLTVKIAQSTNASRQDEPVEIWLGMHDLTIEQAKQTALQLLSAVAVAENAGC